MEPDPLDALGRNIERARRHETPPHEGGARSDLSLAMRLGVEMVSCVLVGGGAGWLLDSWLTTFPWFFLICFSLGTGAGVLTMYRSAMADRPDSP